MNSKYLHSKCSVEDKYVECSSNGSATSWTVISVHVRSSKGLQESLWGALEGSYDKGFKMYITFDFLCDSSIVLPSGERDAMVASSC